MRPTRLEQNRAMERSSRHAARAFVLLAVALVSTAPGPAAAQAVVESLGGSSFVVHESPAARLEALPSYALAPGVPRVAPSGRAPSVLPSFSREGERATVRIAFPEGTSFYGTGEVTGPLRRNGRSTVTWNTDAYGYGESAPSLYQSHPWVLALRPDGSATGLWSDSTHRCEVDTGKSRPNEVRIACEGPRSPVVLIDGKGPAEVVRELSRLTGRMSLPPRWALGWHQSRYSYAPAERVLEVARRFRKERFPLDTIWVDIDYMDGFRSFTFDPKGFPDPFGLTMALSRIGVKSVWILDPGVKADDPPGRYDVLDSGNLEDVWVRGADGKPAEGKVWPGTCRFPDFTDPAVRSWWSRLFPRFLGAGLDGVWVDMNEPAVFDVPSKTLPEESRHRGDPGMRDWAGRAQGERAAGAHARYHNVFGMQEARATRDGVLAARPGMRPFVLTRAGYLGVQRFAATWTGDNTASWEHLGWSVPMVLALGLSGQPFSGPDAGGYVGNGTEQLYRRWIGIASLLPFARGHTGKENADKEPWSYGEAAAATFRRALERRYRLLPYLYGLFREAASDGTPVVRPLFFADPADPRLRGEDASFLLGGDLLVETRASETGAFPSARPKGAWRDFDLVDADPELPRMALRAGAILPLGPPMEWSDEKPLDPITLLVALDEKGQARGTLYEDAGEGFGYEAGDWVLSRYEARREGNRVVVRVASVEGKRKKPARRLVVRVLTEGGREAIGSGKEGTPIVLELRAR